MGYDVVTKADVIARAPAKFLSIYAGQTRAVAFHSRPACEFFEKNPSPSKKEIDDAIGNTSWTILRCDECAKYVDAVAEFDISGEYTHAICVKCLAKAIGDIAHAFAPGEKED